MANTTKNKVTYGLKNVHIWPITATSDEGVPTYGTVINWPGATEIKMDPEGSNDPFYADDSVYYNGVSNTGYSGSLTSADAPEDFLTSIMGYVKDTNGAIIENAEAIPKEFALAFEFKGDAKKRRHLFYRCTAERPLVGSSTKEDKVEPNKPEIKITALPRLDNGNVKARAEEGDAAYDKWYGTTPYEQTATA